MTETTSPTPPTDPPTEPAPLFIRPRDGRMLGGVCAGISERWGFDVTLVRLGAVVLGLLSGIGVAAYLVALLLTPSSDHPARFGPPGSGGRFTTQRSLLLLVLLGIAAFILIHRWMWFGPPIALLVVVLVLTLIVSTWRRRSLIVVGSILGVIVLGLATVGIFGQHFGSHRLTISNERNLDAEYDYAVGSVTLDLSGLRLDGYRHTKVVIGRGDVTVLVPADLPVSVDAYSGLGSVTVNDDRSSGIEPQQDRMLDAAGGGPELDLDVQAGVGSVTVRTS